MNSTTIRVFPAPELYDEQQNVRIRNMSYSITNEGQLRQPGAPPSVSLWAQTSARDDPLRTLLLGTCTRTYLRQGQQVELTVGFGRPA